MRWEERSIAQAYLMESLRGQTGTDGLRTAGYWEWGSKGRETRERGSTVRDHHHCCPHQTTLTTTRPPACHHPARHQPIQPYSFAGQWFSAVMNLQFAHICTVPDMALLWDLFNPLMETFTNKWPQRVINLRINLFLAFRDRPYSLL